MAKQDDAARLAAEAEQMASHAETVTPAELRTDIQAATTELRTDIQNQS